MGFNQIKLLLSLENPITVYILFHDIDIQYIYRYNKNILDT